jgi:hypothetical protein
LPSRRIFRGSAVRRNDSVGRERAPLPAVQESGRVRAGAARRRERATASRTRVVMGQWLIQPCRPSDLFLCWVAGAPARFDSCRAVRRRTHRGRVRLIPLPAGTRSAPTLTGYPRICGTRPDPQVDCQVPLSRLQASRPYAFPAEPLRTPPPTPEDLCHVIPPVPYAPPEPHSS